MQRKFFGREDEQHEECGRMKAESGARDFEDSNVATEVQWTRNEHRAIEPRVRRLKYDPRRHFSRSESALSSGSSNVRCVGGAENVTSTSQKVTRHQNAPRAIEQGLSLFVETSVSSRLGGLCTVSSPGVDQRLKSTRGGTPQGTHGRKSTG